MSFTVAKRSVLLLVLNILSTCMVGVLIMLRRSGPAQCGQQEQQHESTQAVPLYICCTCHNSSGEHTES